MKDYLIRGLAFNDEIRFFVTKTTDLIEEIRRRHDAYPTSIAAVGRTATVTTMMGAMLKSGDRVDIAVRGDGPIGTIYATSDELGETAAYAKNMQVHIPSNSQGKLDVKGAVGAGNITVVRDYGLNEKYTTTSPIVSGEIAEDFTYYFAVSEQVPSCVSLGVLVDTDNSVIAAGGFIFQVLPNATDETITKLEQVINDIKPISSLIHEGKTPEEIADILFGSGENYRILRKNDVVFKCTCSKEKYADALVTLGREELETLAKQKETELVCSFCKQKYLFSQTEITDLLENSQ
ncbi:MULTISPECIES: Hsp33 family molecular chaperone HslO [Gemella]|uniref:Hsp33 family molecular chaperone HslO n=1 Tax=Gemella TaxID=1378 RepID=UPI0007680F4C|nr:MULTISPECIES: Hsp33 family molecular chaperone HslO [Gemella]AME08981.1 molecular chaperone Hsp33 [Gemella sp. oral taxon 928]AXI26551.1 Hsp33 family molecular chaperone HslO [Gemella sp. ND 6198]